MIDTDNTHKMQVVRFLLIVLISLAASARRSRPNKSRPRGCTFEGKKKNEKTCTPFWKIKQPNCHAMNAHRIKRTECSKKFCWKIVDSKTRKGNSNIPSEGMFKPKLYTYSTSDSLILYRSTC